MRRGLRCLTQHRLRTTTTSSSHPFFQIIQSRSPACISCRHSRSVTSSAAPSAPGPNAPDLPAEDAKAQEQTWGQTGWRAFEAAATTFASITILGLVGFAYTKHYKYNVLAKMENAFEPGDPVLELASADEGPESRIHWIERDEHIAIDDIIAGHDQGHYFLIVGEKGQGKTSMILEAMRKVDGEGVSMLEAHADIEVFRIRLGRALDFEYHEDNMGSLFSIRGPRDASALLDIERAFNKLEKVALKRRKRTKKPIVIVINSTNLLRDDDDGRDLLELVQQRAEQWAASNLATMVFNSDDYWVYERLKQHATRMEVLPVKDLTKPKAIEALRKYRTHISGKIPTTQELEAVYERVGGRLSYLIRAAKASDMVSACDDICAKEKQWFLNQCWILGSEMDDDVMDQQKYASAAMVLAKALVDKEKGMGQIFDETEGYSLPSVPLHKARQIMTRADFMQSYDQINIFTIDSNAQVRADSVPMQRAFREICSEEGFDQFLEDTLERIGDIESLGRTRELTIKDLWNGGKYQISTETARGAKQLFEMVTKPPPEDENDDEGDDK